MSVKGNASKGKYRQWKMRVQEILSIMENVRMPVMKHCLVKLEICTSHGDITP